MLCSTCRKKDSCVTPCNKVEEEVLKNCNGISTYRNKEVGVSEFVYETSIVEEYLNGVKASNFEDVSEQNTQFHEEWMQIMKIIDTLLTHKQKAYIKLYLEGYTFAAIGRLFSVSGTAVRYAIFGHYVHGGGAVKKIQISLGIVEK